MDKCKASEQRDRDDLGRLCGLEYDAVETEQAYEYSSAIHGPLGTERSLRVLEAGSVNPSSSSVRSRSMVGNGSFGLNK